MKKLALYHKEPKPSLRKRPFLGFVADVKKDFGEKTNRVLLLSSHGCHLQPTFSSDEKRK